jgi:ribA/ribD-fused uncharacterized protein
VFIRNGGTYYLTDLIIYADGIIDCWGLVPFATFVEKVNSGWVATQIKEGAPANAHHLATWKFAEPWVLGADLLIGEVADEIEHLNGRPTSSERCMQRLERFVADPTEENRVDLAEAYAAVPAHLRMYLLGDQDAKDTPLRTLLTGIGEKLETVYGPTDRTVTPEMHERALGYFRKRFTQRETPEQVHNFLDPDGPDRYEDSVVRFDDHDGGLGFLSSSAEAPFEYDGVTYRTIDHAYWSLATDDPPVREQIARAPRPYDAKKLGQAARRRDGWPVIRLAVMLELLRAKFRQHPDLADRLIATGNARLINNAGFSSYWDTASAGRNWFGHLLEVIRSELLMAVPGRNQDASNSGSPKSG